MSTSSLHRKAEGRGRRAFRAGRQFFLEQRHVRLGSATLADALREHLPKTAPLLEEIAASYGTRKFEKTFAKLYPKCENISVDYAVLEPRSAKGEGKSGIYCIPAGFGWNDLGSWTALLRASQCRQQATSANVIVASSASR